MNNQVGLGDMRLPQILPPQPRSHREAAGTVKIRTDRLRALFGARYFLAGVLIGAAILLAVFLVME